MSRTPRLPRIAWILSLLAAFQSTGFADDFPRDLVSWTPVVEKPVFQGTGANTWDKKIRERGYVLVEDGTFHLWYTGYNQEQTPEMHLGHATSKDGLQWTRDPANPIFKDSWTEDVFILKREGEYIMFAEGKNDVAHQLVSSDRIHWKDLGSLDIRKTDGTPISAGSYGTPTVWNENGTWYLFYERGDRGVWLATSKDRKVWTNVQDDPVLKMGPEPYDLYAVAMNQIIKRGDFYYAFYHANAHMPWKDWTTNLARSRDLIHWEKYPGNPIVKNNCSSPILVSTPQGDRLYTMHPEVRVFRPGEVEKPK